MRPDVGVVVSMFTTFPVQKSSMRAFHSIAVLADLTLGIPLDDQTRHRAGSTSK